MPNPGQANNASGVNGFDSFAPEPPYGQATQDAALQSAAPLASGGLASGAIAAPQRAQKATQQPQSQQFQTGQLPEPPAPVAPPNPMADLWQAVASTPGASDLVIQYAKQAQQ